MVQLLHFYGLCVASTGSLSPPPKSVNMVFQEVPVLFKTSLAVLK